MLILLFLELESFDRGLNVGAECIGWLKMVNFTILVRSVTIQTEWGWFEPDVHGILSDINCFPLIFGIRKKYMTLQLQE